MRDLLSKLISFAKTYKWLLIPIIPSAFFLMLLFSLLSAPKPAVPETSQLVQPTLIQSQQQSNTNQEIVVVSNEVRESKDGRKEDGPATLPGLQKIETLADGNILYTYTSENPTRPKIIIASTNAETLFVRNINTQNKALALATTSVYRQAYGEPEKIIRGSKVYGPDATVYIYASIGVAFIADMSGTTYEEHLFNPMTPDEYMKLYGNQN